MVGRTGGRTGERVVGRAGARPPCRSVPSPGALAAAPTSIARPPARSPARSAARSPVITGPPHRFPRRGGSRTSAFRPTSAVARGRVRRGDGGRGGGRPGGGGTCRPSSSRRTARSAGADRQPGGSRAVGGRRTRRFGGGRDGRERRPYRTVHTPAHARSRGGDGRMTSRGCTPPEWTSAPSYRSLLARRPEAGHRVRPAVRPRFRYPPRLPGPARRPGLSPSGAGRGGNHERRARPGPPVSDAPARAVPTSPWAQGARTPRPARAVTALAPDALGRGPHAPCTAHCPTARTVPTDCPTTPGSVLEARPNMAEHPGVDDST